jgi:hypothetical protein
MTKTDEPTITEAHVVWGFVWEAAQAMRRRMFDGLSRGWGIGFRTNYTDKAVEERLRAATHMLRVALKNHRSGYVDTDELRKRAADVANQAFMLADEERLRDPGSLE